MKTFKGVSSIIVMIPIIAMCLCSCDSCKKAEEDMVPDEILENSYAGTLTVRSTNTYPEWDVSTQINVDIDKELGLVTFESGTLNYSGETIIGGDSKIERSGSWTINPTGRLEQDGNIIYVQVDAGVAVVNDTQRIYAKDGQGNWQLVNETNFDSTPNSDLSFVLDDAVLQGAVISADAGTASLTWILRLSVALDK